MESLNKFHCSSDRFGKLKMPSSNPGTSVKLMLLSVGAGGLRTGVNVLCGVSCVPDVVDF